MSKKMEITVERLVVFISASIMNLIDYIRMVVKGRIKLRAGKTKLPQFAGVYYKRQLELSM
jgi:hypothetical protein